jgi:hypothetical protein
MNATSRYAALVLAVAGSSFLTAGCFASKCQETQQTDGGIATVNKDNCVEFEPGKIFKGQAVTNSKVWGSGGTVTIQNGNGGTTVRADGPSGTVSYSAVPFVIDKASAEQAATNYITNMPPPGIDGDGTSVGIVGEGTNLHGYYMTVTVPTDFNGTIIVKEGNGDVTVSPAGGATQVTADTPVGDITVSGVVGAVALTTPNGGITITGKPNGGTATTDLGDITLTLQSAVNLAVQATASDTVDITPATGWNVNVAAVNSKTVSIGTATPVLTLNAKFGKVTIGGN